VEKGLNNGEVARAPKSSTLDRWHADPSSSVDRQDINLRGKVNDEAEVLKPE
jgi:hypothetical protein